MVWMGGSFQFTLSGKPLSMHNCADPVVWTQDRAGVAELAWVAKEFTKTKYLTHSFEEWTIFDHLFNFSNYFYTKFN